MKLSALLVFTTLFFAVPGTMLCAEKKETVNFFTRTYNLAAGVSSLSLSLAQLGSACTIGYFIYTNVSSDMNDPEYERDASKKWLCALVSSIGLASTPTLLYAAWKTGDFGVQSLRKAFDRKKKPEQRESIDTQEPKPQQSAGL